MVKNQKGFAAVEALLIVLVIGLIGSVGWYVYQNNNNGKNNQTTEDSKSSKVDAQNDEYADWNTYNAKLGGFTLRYPRDWTVIRDESAADPESDPDEVFVVAPKGYDIDKQDGVSVWYTYSQYNEEFMSEPVKDFGGCGVGAPCTVFDIQSLHEVNAGGEFGVMHVIRGTSHLETDEKSTSNILHLYRPVEATNLVKIGKNSYDDKDPTFTFTNSGKKDTYYVSAQIPSFASKDAKIAQLIMESFRSTVK